MFQHLELLDGILDPNIKVDVSKEAKPMNNIQPYSVVDWMTKTTDNVLWEFAQLPNAKRIGTGDRQFVLVEGTRSDRVLLIAHSDTKFNDAKLEIGYDPDKNELVSLSKTLGIGADDRAGIAMLWRLKDLGHSLLIPNKEEEGCKGSRFLMEDEQWRKIINSHRFAIEMDRRNARDLVYYNVGTRLFKVWCEKEFEGYKEAPGSFTDIGVLCDPQKHKENCICGLNISVGYYGEHGPSEKLVISEWIHTLESLTRVLSKPDIPEFKILYEPYVAPTYTQGKYDGMHNYGYQAGWSDDYDDGKTATVTTSVNSDDILNSIVLCSNCDAMMDISEISPNNKCVYCKKAV